MDFSLTDNHFCPDLYPCDDGRCFFMLHLKTQTVIFLLRNGKLVASATSHSHIWFFPDGSTVVDKYRHTLYRPMVNGQHLFFSQPVSTEGKMAGNGVTIRDRLFNQLDYQKLRPGMINGLANGERILISPTDHYAIRYTDTCTKIEDLHTGKTWEMELGLKKENDWCEATEDGRHILADIVPTSHLSLLLGDRFPTLRKMLEDHQQRMLILYRYPGLPVACLRIDDKKVRQNPFYWPSPDGRSLVIDTENLLMDTEKKGCLLYRY